MDATLRLKDPIAPQLVQVLRQAIIAVELRPGEALSEKEIAGRFGVSRQPVREAFIKLAEAGLVQVLPSRGTYVMKISMRAVANARFVREAVECAIARAATTLITPAQVARLRALIEGQRNAAALDDHAGFSVLDEDFHQLLAEIVDCDYAGRVVEGARAQTDRVRYLSLPGASPAPLLISQHVAIVDAIEARDADGAETQMRKHLREILNALPRIAHDHPELFEDEIMPEHTRTLHIP
ncbi:GntR family transcriptional regulator [Bosea caraganae]|uniref:GntR family transcriptional regulator n=1 Tax=Bosea caraganae TaxID=2763117 RepID=A0A370L3M1_9HYPH|nr:GntR family transcriptional regulator [Bosea caraganae]RDJ22940.1 GntR family transcriptional regulator [Bosea caraganae]RDJ28720.1 GntR family transcriptional regulator [Bosea caraganae]